ncbi:Pectate lyase superfamily protein [Cognatiyoonia koreensis]|uniref:Pectate lyase superfamily protein n=1 Tax=Cognatiyoonia koreensis TaxID=364200 RepID=A0A1I0MVC0_9RHOB|nr:glycosyl hydrolase family 28-related protein [Cognatiyoonia koreensis]SEV92339.1 Pectate lyase superfamily protein [Cognatiyoonia koreensis]
MNKAITDGIVLMPLPFAAGLGVWSSGDGTPGSDTYALSGNGVFVAADQDFGGCLEINKTSGTTRVRYMGETPILPGCYLRVTARFKAVAGPLPNVRIAAFAGDNSGDPVGGLDLTAPSTSLTTYGEIVEVSAIVGTGDRNGVDLVWQGAAYGHFGIDLTGPNGGLVRLDDLVIEDITSAFQRDMLSLVDVRDYGAIGDGSADDSAAFEAADAAAQGRTVLVSKGVYKLEDSVTLSSRVKFEGTVVQSANHRFILQKDFNYATYVDAFGDEETAFKKAYQALLNFSDHESLDLCGRRITLSEPLDMQAADPSRTVFATRRVIRNGQFQPEPGSAWNTDSVTSQATYSASNPNQLTNVIDVANVVVGARVSGTGVGREIYVRATNVGQKTVTLSQPLYDAVGTQTYTFRRYKYLLDFSGYDDLAQFVIDDVEFQCNGHASGILLAPQGLTFHLRDCFVTKPKNRGLTSIGTGCQGMMIDRCNFASNEQPLPVQDRTTIGFNANANDVKIRDNRVALFKHFCVLGGTGTLISGNHWFHGDNEDNGVRKGGIIITTPNCKSIITGNYCDNNFIEWTNEHSAEPALGAQFSFGGLTITGNIFTTNDVADWFNFIVIKPYGPNHFIHGFSVVSNVFRSINGFIDKVEHVDTSLADLDYGRMRGVTFAANTFHSVRDEVYNPAILSHDESTPTRTWVAENAPYLPFGGRARFVDSVMADGPLKDSSDATVYEMPYVNTDYGPDQSEVRFVFKTAVEGRIRYQVRMDNPL